MTAETIERQVSTTDLQEILEAFGRRLLVASDFDVERAKRMARIAAVAIADEFDTIEGGEG